MRGNAGKTSFPIRCNDYEANLKETIIQNGTVKTVPFYNFRYQYWKSKVQAPSGPTTALSVLVT